MKSRSALLVGATGLVGVQCLEQLLSDETYSSVTVLTRRIVEREHEKLTVHLVDFDRLDQHANLLKGDDVFCCLGTTIRVAGSQEAFRRVDFTYAMQTGAISVKNGAEQFLVVSAVGASSRSGIFYNRVKGELEEGVAKLPFRAIHIFRPSILLGKRKEVRPGETIGIAGMKMLSMIMAGPFRKYRPIAAQTVARAMVDVAKGGREGLYVYESDKIQTISDAL
jgi:uncharacterized protein YbjT (DUF2867 family)